MNLSATIAKNMPCLAHNEVCVPGIYTKNSRTSFDSSKSLVIVNTFHTTCSTIIVTQLQITQP